MSFFNALKAKVKLSNAFYLSFLGLTYVYSLTEFCVMHLSFPPPTSLSLPFWNLHIWFSSRYSVFHLPFNWLSPILVISVKILLGQEASDVLVRCRPLCSHSIFYYSNHHSIEWESHRLKVWKNRFGLPKEQYIQWGWILLYGQCIWQTITINWNYP